MDAERRTGRPRRPRPRHTASQAPTCTRGPWWPATSTPASPTTGSGGRARRRRPVHPAPDLPRGLPRASRTPTTASPRSTPPCATTWPTACSTSTRHAGPGTPRDRRGVVRWGLMVALDLEQYSWNAGRPHADPGHRGHDPRPHPAASAIRREHAARTAAHHGADLDPRRAGDRAAGREPPSGTPLYDTDLMCTAATSPAGRSTDDDLPPWSPTLWPAARRPRPGQPAAVRDGRRQPQLRHGQEHLERRA